MQPSDLHHLALRKLAVEERKFIKTDFRGFLSHPFDSRIGLPTRTTYNKEKVLAEMLHDKKAQGGQITVIKVPGLGCWRAETIPVEGLRPLLGVEE